MGGDCQGGDCQEPTDCFFVYVELLSHKDVQNKWLSILEAAWWKLDGMKNFIVEHSEGP